MSMVSSDVRLAALRGGIGSEAILPDPCLNGVPNP